MLSQHPCKAVSCCCCSWLLVVLVPFLISLAIEEAYWAAPKIPRLVFDAIPPDDTALRYLEVTSEQALLEQLNEASSKGENVRAIGGGWSWNPGAYPAEGGVVLALRGELASIGELQCSDDSNCTIEAGGGAWMYDLVPTIVGLGFQSSAKGLCLNSDRGQSLGGVIATNVHDTFSPTFAEAVISLRLAHFTPNGTAVAVTYNRSDKAFGYSIGTVGRGGVIISAVLSVEVLRTYTWGTRRTQQPYMAALFQRMASKEVCPATMALWINSRSAVETRCTEVNATASRELFLEPAPAAVDLLREVIEGAAIWDRQLLSGSVVRSFVEDVITSDSGKTGNWHASHANLLPEQHIEMEFFVPFDHAARALESLQELLQSNPRWKPSALALRQVPPTVAPMAPSAGSPALAVNIDFFFDRDWEEFQRLQHSILESWESLQPPLPFVRLHTGKFVAPGITLEYGFPEQTLTEFAALIDEVDPNSVFRTPLCKRDQMDLVYRSRTPAPAVAVAYVFWALTLSGVGLLVFLIVLCLRCCCSARSARLAAADVEAKAGADDGGLDAREAPADSAGAPYKLIQASEA